MGSMLVAHSPFGHEDRSTPWLGMVVALASWAMMFAALFLAYVLLRVQQQVWPPLGTPPLPQLLPALNTFVLLASSVSLHFGLRRMRRLQHRNFVFGVFGAIGLGLGFMGLQVLLWQHMHSAGLSLEELFGSIFYLLTWFHAFHIVAGLLALAWLGFGAVRHRYGPDRQVPVLLISAFWHFLTVMWMFMYVAIFLV